jgi:tetratricopeptide (TPR) repeat protein
MNRITYLIIFFVLLAVGCTNDGRTNKSLVEIDSLLGKGMVDSAYNCLQAIPQKDLRTTDDSAYYYLLDTQSKYRLYKPIETTKDIEFSIRVYSKGTENSDKLASAYYYKSMASYDLGRIRESVIDLKKAEFISRKSKDLALKHKIYGGFVMVNEKAGENRAALEYSLKSADVSKRMKNASWLANAYNYMVALYDRLGMKDSSDFYLKKSMELVKKCPQKDVPYIMVNIGVYLMHTKPEVAKTYLKKAIEVRPIEEAYVNLAAIYANEGKAKEAISMWRKVEESDNMRAKGQALYSMLSFHMKNEDYRSAALTARRLVELKDSLLNKRDADNVKAIQSEFDVNVSRQEYERKITFSLVAVVLLALLAVIVFLYSRYKTYKMKAAVAKDQMLISNYERQVADLERQGQDNRKEIEAINRRKEKLLDRHRDTLNRGYQLFSDVTERGKTTVLWKKHDFEIVIEYYRLTDVEFVDKLETAYDEISPKYKFFLILEHIGKTDKEIMAAMCIADVTVRSIRSRVNKKKKDVAR